MSEKNGDPVLSLAKRVLTELDAPYTVTATLMVQVVDFLPAREKLIAIPQSEMRLLVTKLLEQEENPCRYINESWEP